MVVGRSDVLWGLWEAHTCNVFLQGVVGSNKEVGHNVSELSMPSQALPGRLPGHAHLHAHAPVLIQQLWVRDLVVTTMILISIVCQPPSQARLLLGMGCGSPLFLLKRLPLLIFAAALCVFSVWVATRHHMVPVPAEPAANFNTATVNSE